MHYKMGFGVKRGKNDSFIQRRRETEASAEKGKKKKTQASDLEKKKRGRKREKGRSRHRLVQRKGKKGGGRIERKKSQVRLKKEGASMDTMREEKGKVGGALAAQRGGGHAGIVFFLAGRKRKKGVRKGKVRERQRETKTGAGAFWLQKDQRKREGAALGKRGPFSREKRGKSIQKSRSLPTKRKVLFP